MWLILQSLGCTVCTSLIQNLLLEGEGKVTPVEIDVVKAIAVEVCLHASVVDMGDPVDKEVCVGIVNEFIFEVTFILFQSYLRYEQAFP
tara:strand:- start:36 stop:302 length:267 start_codon:yes stop_codon:yes gene_type:complete